MGVIGARRVKAISMLEWERELRGRGPLPGGAGRLPCFGEPSLCSVPLSGSDRQGVACWCLGTAGRESVWQRELWLRASGLRIKDRLFPGPPPESFLLLCLMPGLPERAEGVPSLETPVQPVRDKGPPMTKVVSPPTSPFSSFFSVL